MKSCVYPVVILLTLCFLARALDTSTLDYPQRESKYSLTSRVDDFHEDSARKLRRPAAKIHRPSAAANAISTKSKISVTKGVAKGGKPSTKLAKVSTSFATKTNKLAFIDLSLKSKELEARERRRKQKKKMNRAMIALLMAYKLKFAALIPTIIGGLILLLSTTALAGFFFALFAAVLGLKAH